MRRSGDTLESGSTKEPRTEKGIPRHCENVDVTNALPRESGFHHEVHMEDYGIFLSNEVNIRSALVPQDIQAATSLPTAGWPPYRDLYRRDPPALLLYEASQIAGLGAVDPRTTYHRAEGKDIVSRALKAAGAERADPAQWLMMNEKVNMYSPMALLDYVVYRIPTRIVRGRCNLGGHWGVRLGPRARGPPPQKMWAPKKMPPSFSAQDCPNFGGPPASRVPGVLEHGRMLGLLGDGVPVLGRGL